MRGTRQLAQRSRATKRCTPSIPLGVAAETVVDACVRLENPLGVSADRSVEARSYEATEKRLHAAAHQGEAEPEQLANGAQENGLQHRCASSAVSLSPIFDTADEAFDYWFRNFGHWIYESREEAAAAWKKGLSA